MAPWAHGRDTWCCNRTIPISAIVSNQSVIAGLGNIYRAEALLVTGNNPRMPAHEVPGSHVDKLQETSVALLRRGVRDGKIVTVTRARGKTEADRLYVYKCDRFSCRQCGGPISTTEMADRSIWRFEVCQPR